MDSDRLLYNSDQRQSKKEIRDKGTEGSVEDKLWTVKQLNLCARLSQKPLIYLAQQ